MRKTLVKTEEFKDSPLGKIPTDWDVVPLSSIFQIQTGATPLRTKHQLYFAGGMIPWVKTMDLNEGWIVNTDERITGIALKECSVQLLPPKTVLIAMYGGWEQIGRTGILKDSATTNQAISSLIKISPLVEPEFVLRALQYGRFRWKGIAASTRKDPNITRDDVVNFLIPLPPLDEQQRIAEILETVDETIAHTSSLIAKLKQMKAGLLHDLLTRGLDENGELRDAIGHPEQFKDSPLGRIPKDWEVVKLVDHISLPNGQLDPKQQPYCNWVLIAPDHIESETGRILNLQTAAEQNAISGKYGFQLGDVLYSKIRPYLRKAVLADREGLCSADMYPLRPEPTIVSRFLLALILGEDFSRFATAVSMRSGFPKINRDELSEYQLALPTYKEQQRIAEILDTYDTRIRTEEAYRDKLKLQKKGLMHDLLTGKVRVKDAHKFTPASDTV